MDEKGDPKGGSGLFDHAQTSAQRQGLAQGLGPEVNSAGDSGPGSQRGITPTEELEKSGVGESKRPGPAPPDSNHPQGGTGTKPLLPTLNGQTYINHLTWREAGATSALGGNTPSLNILSIHPL